MNLPLNYCTHLNRFDKALMIEWRTIFQWQKKDRKKHFDKRYNSLCQLSIDTLVYIKHTSRVHPNLLPGLAHVYFVSENNLPKLSLTVVIRSVMITTVPTKTFIAATMSTLYNILYWIILKTPATILLIYLLDIISCHCQRKGNVISMMTCCFVERAEN